MATETDGYRALAAAVLLRAIRDANGVLGGGVAGRKRKAVMLDARRFLSPDNEELKVYCDGPDIDTEAFCEAVKKNGRALALNLMQQDRSERRKGA